VPLSCSSKTYSQLRAYCEAHHRGIRAGAIEFIRRYPDVPRLRLVRYALAVRLARADQYDEAATIYSAIGANARAARMRQLAGLFTEMNDQTLSDSQHMEAEYRFADILARNPERVYFNDTLWHQFQNHALTVESDVRLTKAERDSFVSGERNLRDQQEERWRAYLILNGIVERSGNTALGRKAARLALRCLRGIATQRFGRERTIEQADIRLSNWLPRPNRVRLRRGQTEIRAGEVDANVLLTLCYTARHATKSFRRSLNRSRLFMLGKRYRVGAEDGCFTRGPANPPTDTRSTHRCASGTGRPGQ